MKRSNLFSGTLILSIGAILSKVFSAIYRIVLTRILGGEGIGLYQLIFPIYSLCVVLATAGIPMAISKVVSKHIGQEKFVIKKCLLFTTIIGLTLSFILLVSSKGLAILQGQKQLSICYLILAPTIIVVSVSSVLRGYFQGKHNFIPSSISNIVEQFVKMLIGLILSFSLINISLFASIIGAIVAIVLSEILSLIVLLFYIKKEKIKSSGRCKISIKELAKDIMPITLTNLILPISNFIDSVLVVNLLSVNFSNDISVFLFGLESGAVSSLISLPTIFSFAIASVVLPNITYAKHNLNKSYKLSLSIKTVLLITIPCVLCFTLIPNRLIEVLYHSQLNSYGLNGVNIASKLLSISGFGIVFLAINQVYSSSLQAVDERFVAIRNLTIAVVIKLVIESIFLPSKFLNIYALATANTVCYVTVMILNHLEIKEMFDLRIDYMFWCKLILANGIMLLALLSVLAIESSAINTIFAIVVAVIAYFLSLFQTNIFTKKDKAIFKYKI